MLSTGPLKNVSSTSHYFTSGDNYYMPEEGELNSSWWGSGAARLGLEGEVDAAVFTALLKGEIPNGEHLGIERNGEWQHRPGHDLTFSVPKSVSLVGLLGGDKRVIQAIHTAVDTALAFVERDCAEARFTAGGETRHELTRNLVIAKFLHDLSREIDPQLHIHCVVLNMTQRLDGKWRSLSSSMGDHSANAQEVHGFIERIHHNQHFYDRVFLSELAFQLKGLGYDIRETGKHGLFEIEGISAQSIEAYSRRRQQIKEYMEEHGLTKAEAAALANKNTRQRKQNVTPERVNENWQRVSEKAGIDGFGEARAAVEKSFEKLSLQKGSTSAPEKESASEPADFGSTAQKENSEKPITIARDLVLRGIDKLSKKEVSFSEAELLSEAILYQKKGEMGVDPLLAAVEELKKDGTLLILEKRSEEASRPVLGSNHGETYFTTKQLIEHEKTILKTALENHSENKAFVSTEKIEAYFKAPQDISLTRHQAQTVTELFQTTNKIVMLQGAAQTGKTTILKPIMEISRLGDYRPILLSPTQAEKLDFESRFKKEPETVKQALFDVFHGDQYATVAGFLNDPKSFGTGTFLAKKPALIVENAHRLSLDELVKLTNVLEQHQGRLILLGDRERMPSGRAGTPFQQLMDQGARSVELTESHSKSDMKAALSDTLDKNIEAAFAKLNGRIVAMEDKAERVSEMAKHYTALEPDQRFKAVLLMPSKVQADEMNLAVRQELRAEGVLKDSQNLNTTVLLPKYVEREDLVKASSYAVGNWVQFKDTYLTLFVAQGEYLKVAGIGWRGSQEDGHPVVILKGSMGRTIRWNPEKVAAPGGKVQIFEEEKREISVGDYLVSKKNDRTLSVYAGDRLVVEGIEGGEVTLSHARRGERFTVNLNANENKHFDYGYATTPYQSTLEKFDTIISYQKSSSRQTDQKYFYNMLAEARQGVYVYTENANAYLKNLKAHTGDKVTAIDQLLKNSESTISAEFQTKNFQSADAPKLDAAIQRSVHLASLPKVVKTTEEMAQDSVQYALLHLTEREAAFTHKELIDTAEQFMLGSSSIKQIEHAIFEARDHGRIVQGKSGNQVIWTTPEAIAIENETVHLATKDKAKLPQLVSENVLKNTDFTGLSNEQQTVLMGLFENRSRVIDVEGFSGTGKSTMMKKVEEVTNAANIEFYCVAPTHVAKDGLLAQGQSAETVDAFLAKHRGLLENPPENIPNSSNGQTRLFIGLDEASMVSNRRMRDFFLVVDRLGARAFLVGDTRQFSSIESGKPKWLLQKNDIESFSLTDIKRQQNPVLLKAVQASYKNDWKQFFTLLKPYTHEIKDTEKRLEKMAEDYLALSPAERAETLVITAGNKDRIMVNELIREGLTNTGELKGRGFITEALISSSMTQVEKTQIKNYGVGDILRFGMANSLSKIKKGEYLQITGLDEENRFLILAREKGGNSVLFRMPSKIEDVKFEVYSSQEREVKVGDLIRWTRSQRDLKLLSPDINRVIQIDQNNVFLQKVEFTKSGMQSTGKIFAVDLTQKQYQHFDHSYAMTTYSTQSKTISRALIHMDSGQQNLTSKMNALVSVGRAVNDVVLYVDDAKDVQKQVERNSGQKRSALAVMGELPGQKKVQAAQQAQQQAKQKEADELAQTGSSSAKSQSFKSAAKTSKPRFDSNAILEQLNANLEVVVEALLGAPKDKNAREMRFGGNKGSLLVTLSGERRGLWKDFQTDEGGNLFTLIGRNMGLSPKAKGDFPKILARACEILSLPAEMMQTQTANRPRPEKPKSNEPAVFTESQQRNIKYAKKLARESRHLTGTLAERYLQEHRSIYLEKYPDSVRFHPGVYSRENGGVHPALLVVAKNKLDEIQSVQAIFLDEKTAKKAKLPVEKQTFGPSGGAAVRLEHGDDKKRVTLLAEGPETGLSLLQAMPEAQVQISLGKSNLKNVPIESLNKEVIVCLDNDPAKDKTDSIAKENAAREIAKRLVDGGKAVKLTKPVSVNDYNDLLKESGADAIRLNVYKAESFEQYFKALMPESPKIPTAAIEKSQPAKTHTPIQSTPVQKVPEKIKQREIEF